MTTAGGIRLKALLERNMRFNQTLDIVAKVMVEHEATGCVFYPGAGRRIAQHIPGVIEDPIEVARTLGDVLEAEELVCPARGIDRRPLQVRLAAG